MNDKKVSFYEDGIAGEIYGEKITSKEEQMTTDDSFKLANVQCFPLYSILLAVRRTQVDYFSVDVEGSESQILMNVPWHKVNIKVIYYQNSVHYLTSLICASIRR